jgi:ribonuclease HI
VWHVPTGETLSYAPSGAGGRDGVPPRERPNTGHAHPPHEETVMSEHPVHLYTDGAARGNPGPAAAAWVVVDPSTGEVLVEGAEAIGEATNNVAEYTAIIRGLEACAGRVVVHSDSELCVRQLREEYRVRKAHLVPLHRRVREMSFEEVEFVHVPRDNEWISRCDALANEVLG